MIGTLEVALELAEFVRKENQDGKVDFPTSITHLKLWSSYFSRSIEEIQNILILLKETHFIFIFNLVEPDEAIFSQGEAAYLFADITIIEDLRRKTELLLEQTYLQVYFRKKSAFLIIRELFTRSKDYNSTGLGRLINIIIMLEEYSKIINANNFEYTGIWRQNKIFDAYEKDELPQGGHSTIEETESTPILALDSSPVPVEEKDTSDWSMARKELSLELLIRIHFRKYEFAVVKRLIHTGKIKSERDLKIVRDTLVTIGSKAIDDNILSRFQFEIDHLRRYCNGKINILRNNQTGHV